MNNPQPPQNPDPIFELFPACPLHIGDRVRVITCDDWDAGDGDLLDGDGGVYIETEGILGECGTVVKFGIPYAIVKMDNGEEYDFSGKCLESATRRTFLEIINALIADLNKLTEENDYGLHQINTAGTAVIWYEPIPGEITYYDITQEGEFGTDKDYTFTPAAHLAAIAAACTEIAETYAAEHGKEDTRHA